jgi:hypothetical protein
MLKYPSLILVCLHLAAISILMWREEHTLDSIRAMQRMQEMEQLEKAPSPRSVAAKTDDSSNQMDIYYRPPTRVKALYYSQPVPAFLLGWYGHHLSLGEHPPLLWPFKRFLLALPVRSRSALLDALLLCLIAGQWLLIGKRIYRVSSAEVRFNWWWSGPTLAITACAIVALLLLETGVALVRHSGLQPIGSACQQGAVIVLTLSMMVWVVWGLAGAVKLGLWVKSRLSSATKQPDR